MVFVSAKPTVSGRAWHVSAWRPSGSVLPVPMSSGTCPTCGRQRTPFRDVVAYRSTWSAFGARATATDDEEYLAGGCAGAPA